MKSKIRWYKEVLEIEPQSKVFFPLAKLLVENDEFQEASKVLKQGLLRHPEFMEAKLLLADVLNSQDKNDELEDIVGDISSDLAEHSVFWEVWARQLAREKDGQDSALAMQLLAAFFSGKTITWGKVIEHGLKSLLNENLPEPGLAGVEALAKAKLDDAHEIVADEQDAADEAGEFAEAVHSLPLDDSERPETSDEEPDDNGAVSRKRLENFEAAVADTDLEPRTIEGAASTMKEIQEAGGAVEDEDDEYDEGDEEAFSLRTKTMADLLAEQGDYAGALDIYRELVVVAPDEETRKELEALAEDMLALSKEKPGGNGGRGKKTKSLVQKDESKGLKSKTKLINALESLASRLEAKAAN